MNADQAEVVATVMFTADSLQKADRGINSLFL
jgi:hypothetical protein